VQDSGGNAKVQVANTGQTKWGSGASLIGYSDNFSTQKWLIDSSTGNGNFFALTLANSVLNETTPASAGVGFDVCYGDSTAHLIKCSYNGDSFFPLPRVIASGTSTLTSGSVTTNTCQTAVTTAATGATFTDAIEWSYATAPGTADALLHISPYPTANNVNFTRCNATNASQTGTAIVINWRVVR
jgi:hypothetical protein